MFIKHKNLLTLLHLLLGTIVTSALLEAKSFKEWFIPTNSLEYQVVGYNWAWTLANQQNQTYTKSTYRTRTILNGFLKRTWRWHCEEVWERRISMSHSLTEKKAKGIQLGDIVQFTCNGKGKNKRTGKYSFLGHRSVFFRNKENINPCYSAGFKNISAFRLIQTNTNMDVKFHAPMVVCLR